MAACQVAGIAHVHLHGFHGRARKQLLVVDALAEGGDPQIRMPALQFGQVDLAFAPRKLERMLRLLESVRPQMIPLRGDSEMRCIAAFGKHGCHIAAHCHRAALDQTDLRRQVEIPLVLGEGPQIRGGLPVVFFPIFQVRGLHRTDGPAREADTAQLGRDAEIADMQFLARYLIEGPDTAIGEHVPEVLNVESPGQAFATEHRIVIEALGHPAIGKDVGKVQLTSRLEHAEDLLEQLPLEWGKVHDAVGDDQVHAFAGNGLHILDEALDEGDVRLGIAEALPMRFLETLRKVQLRRGHVDADDMPMLADQLACDIHIAAGPATQVEYRGTLEPHGDGRSAPVEARDHLGVDILQGIDHILGRRRCRTAGRIGAQIVATLQKLAVVAADLFPHTVVACHAGPLIFLTRKSAAKPPRRIRFLLP